MEAAFLGRRKSLRELGFTILILAALYHLATQGSWRLEGLSVSFLLSLSVPALWSIAHVIIREALVTTPITPNQVTVSRLIASTAVLLPLALALEGPQAVEAVGLDAGIQSFAALMGLAYYLELIFWFNAVRHIDVSVASSITVPAPAVTMVLASVLLGETIHGAQFAALGLVILGLFGLLHASEDRKRRGESISANPSGETT